MKRREFLSGAGGAVAGIAARPRAVGATPGPKRRPNVLMITCHDIGQHLGCYGVESVNTPNLDRLAARGIRFENCYSTSAVCSPGRGSLHTGRYPQSNGLMGLTHAPWWWSLNDDERHSAQVFRDLGYESVLAGFIHVGDWRRMGYDRYLSRESKATETVAAAQKLIGNAGQRSKPFFAKVGFTEVHRPFTHGEDRSKGVFVPGWLQATPVIEKDLAEYQAQIRFFDEQVGKILDTLEKSDIAQETLVVMTSDHGIPYPGAKWAARKAGLEVPLILHQPGTALSGGKVFPQVMSNVDVLPTLLEWMGEPAPARIEGVSFRGVLEGDGGPSPRETAFGQYTTDMKRDNASRTVITDRYQLIRYFSQGRAVGYPVDVDPVRFAGHVERCRTTGTRPFAQLYDLRADPYELTDIGGKQENAGIVADLSKRLLSWMREVDDPLLKGPERTPYYDRSMQDFLNAG